MAKKKNIVMKAKSRMTLLLTAAVVVGWLLAASTVLVDPSVEEQAALVATAKTFLADKLYIRAVKQYQKALSEYTTQNNPIYETELLAVYKEAGMLDDYYELIDERRAKQTAQLDEYMDRAQGYIDTKTIQKAIPVLQEGISRYPDSGLTDLYESVRYEYSPVSTTFVEMQIPAGDWYIPAFDGTHWGYVGDNGRTILEFIYDEATSFAGSYAVVKLDGRYTLIDKNGYWNAIDQLGLDHVDAISGSRIVAEKDGQYGIYTNTFVKVSEEAYEDVCMSANGIYAVKKGDKWALLNAELEPVTDFLFSDIAKNSKGQLFEKDYAVVADESGYFLINAAGEACFSERFEEARGMEGGLFAVKNTNGKWGFANEKGEIVVECRYEDAHSFSDQLAAVRYAGKWGYINRYDTMIIEPQFAAALPFLEGRALVVDETGFYRILELKYYDLF